MQPGCLTGGPDARVRGDGCSRQDLPAEPERKISRPNCAPAYYLGRPAQVWITAMRRRHTTSIAWVGA